MRPKSLLEPIGLGIEPSALGHLQPAQRANTPVQPHHMEITP